MTRPGIEPRSPGRLANTLTARPMSGPSNKDKPTEIRTNPPITRIISKQLDIKLGPLTKEEHDSVLRKIKNRKAAGLDEIPPPEVWNTRQFDDILLRHCNAVCNQNPIYRWMKGCILPFPKMGDLGLAKNYRGITLTL